MSCLAGDSHGAGNSYGGGDAGSYGNGTYDDGRGNDGRAGGPGSFGRTGTEMRRESTVAPVERARVTTALIAYNV